MLCMWKVELYSQKLLAKEEKRKENGRSTTEVNKRQQRTVSSWLASSNIYSVLCPEKLENKVSCQDNTEGVKNVWYTLWPLREVWIKVGLEKLENHKEIAVKALLEWDNRTIYGHKAHKTKIFRLEKLKNPLLVQNIDGTVNVGGAITYQIECNMFFKEHIERA